MMQNVVITVIVAASIYAARDNFKAWPPGVNMRIPHGEGDPEEKGCHGKFVVKDGELFFKMKNNDMVFFPACVTYL